MKMKKAVIGKLLVDAGVAGFLLTWGYVMFCIHIVVGLFYSSLLVALIGEDLKND